MDQINVESLTGDLSGIQDIAYVRAARFTVSPAGFAEPNIIEQGIVFFM